MVSISTYTYITFHDDVTEFMTGGLLSWDMASRIQFTTHNCRKSDSLDKNDSILENTDAPRQQILITYIWAFFLQNKVKN